MKVSLWLLGEFSEPHVVENSIACIKKAIGSLPLEEEKHQPNQMNEEESKKSEISVKKIRVKTIILPDGTYGTEVINETDPKTGIFMIRLLFLFYFL